MAFMFKMENINDYCDKCKSKPCPRPCRFVDEILAHDNRAVMERQTGETIQNMPQKRMIRFSETDMPSQDVIPDDRDSHWEDGLSVPQVSKSATVFFLRFFKMMGYKEISTYIDSTPDAAAKHYHYALLRVNEILDFLDRKGTAEKLVAKDDGLMTDNQKMFVCKSVLKLTTSQISKLYMGRIKPKTISERVRKEVDSYCRNFSFTKPAECAKLSETLKTL